MCSKIQFVFVVLAVLAVKESLSACCGRYSGPGRLQAVRFGYPCYETCGCPPFDCSYPPSFAPGYCNCGASSTNCFRGSDCPCNVCSPCKNTDNAVCSCFKALKDEEGGCGCPPLVYFPEVEYPVAVIDAIKPFYYGSCF